MDLASKRIPLILICILSVIFVVQLLLNDTGRVIDIDTCEIWVKDTFLGRHYTGEFDQKCLDLKAALP